MGSVIQTASYDHVWCQVSRRTDSNMHNTYRTYDSTIRVLLDFSLTVKAATLIFISGCSSAISSAKVGKSDFIYNLVKNQ